MSDILYRRFTEDNRLTIAEIGLIVSCLDKQGHIPQEEDTDTVIFQITAVLNGVEYKSEVTVIEDEEGIRTSFITRAGDIQVMTKLVNHTRDYLYGLLDDDHRVMFEQRCNGGEES